MASPTVPYLYRETRLNLDPADPTAAVSIALRAQQAKRKTGVESYVGQDEGAFERRHIAAEASIFFRSSSPQQRENGAGKSPRSILWRVLDGRRVLELQAVDLYQSQHAKHDALVTLALHFPAPIRPFGLAFADLERDGIVVFALTEGSMSSALLYTITIWSEFFVKLGATEVDVGEWCKTFAPSSFSLRSPYKMVAAGPWELLISTDDGGMLRLTREPGQDGGSNWRETLFADGGWKTSLRGLVGWKGHNSIPYNGLDLEPATVAAIALSPDTDHIFTVSLNHTLKAWNLRTGKIGVQTDLLGRQLDPQKAPTYTLPPGQQQLMQILEVWGTSEGDEYFVVTYSPQQQRFKFWGIRDADSAFQGIRDIHSELSFIPPLEDLMNTTVWNVEDFYIKSGQGWRNSQMWIRVRSGANCRVFHLFFDLFDDEADLRENWKNNWSCVDQGGTTVVELRHHPDLPRKVELQNDSLHLHSVTERWLGFLLHPGRFTIPTLETSLTVYCRGKKLRDQTVCSDKVPLKERICTAIALSVQQKGHFNYDQQEQQVHSEWNVYYLIIKDLHRQRGEALALAYDNELDMPWLVLSDYVSCIRQCSENEILTLNSSVLLDVDPNESDLPIIQSLQNQKSVMVAALLNAGQILRHSFSEAFQEHLKRALLFEILQEPSVSVPDRIKRFASNCGLEDELSDEIVSRTAECFGGEKEIRHLSKALFFEAVSRLKEEPHGRRTSWESTRYGAKMLIRGAHETLQLGTEILLNLLLLTVFMKVEYEETNRLHKDFDACDIFVELVTQLREHAVLSWLASKVRTEPRRHNHRRSSDGEAALSSSVQSTADSSSTGTTSTLLESLFVGDWAGLPAPSMPLSALVGYWCRTWTYGADLSRQYDPITEFIMGSLLKSGNADLAAEFEPYLPRSAWGAYLRGRLCLMEANWVKAGWEFKKGAYALAFGGSKIKRYDTSYLLDVEERDFFSEGLPRYYRHILNLFSRYRQHSFVIEFAQLALRSFPVNAAMDEPTRSMRSDILSQLFSASIHTNKFDEAYSALTLYSDHALRKSALRTLIQHIITASHQPSLLLHYPFASLQNDVDDVLSSLAHSPPSFPSPTSSSLTFSSTYTPLGAASLPFHKALYAWRVARNDFRGAAAALYERGSLLKRAVRRGNSTGKVTAATSNLNEALVENYVLLINLLASVSVEQAWVLVAGTSVGGVSTGAGIGNPNDGDVSMDGASGDASAGVKMFGVAKQAKRKVVTLEDVRREYQEELDRAAAIEQGRFAFAAPGGGGDEMDVL
ncbi:nucleoporin Nup120/160-domain-containing protein [Lineolata rhizophorae]|uniref:Nucleoporin Nup120/160-domain-containing protein n=1 Tax=Lineolata rhizophorae TaxID=578093 RepID=A0A6A6P9Z9_9PEZI|nr:nucleoporin Nup120/160-domain-containing protein [Lineolata rhizophorae]